MILVPEEILWKSIKRMAFSNCYHSLSRCEEYGIQRETITRRTNGGYGIGKSSTSYFIDNVDKEFKTLEEMVEFFNEKFQYEEDNPKQEVVYIKVIRDRKS
ncbi:MAG: hypothetical protein AAFO03_08060 [Bacteroidota bacterium]